MYKVLSFAPGLLLNDVTLELVIKHLVHSRIGITQAYYGGILEEKVTSEFDKLTEKIYRRK